MLLFAPHLSGLNLLQKLVTHVMLTIWNLPLIALPGGTQPLIWSRLDNASNLY